MAEIALAILEAEIYPTTADNPVHPYTFDKYMLDEECTVVDGVSIGPVSQSQRKRQCDSAATYLMAAPLWGALRTLAGGARELAPEQVTALRLHPIILDRIVSQERWHQRACMRESEAAETELRQQDEARTARGFAIASRRFELLKDEFGALCKKLGMTPYQEPGAGRGK